MTWTSTAPERVWEPFVADERTTLEGFLDKQRTTLLWFKCSRHANWAGSVMAEA